MSLNQRVTAEFSTCTPSAPPTADLSIQTSRPEPWIRRSARLDERIARSHQLRLYLRCVRHSGVM
jgi:hypothetical protein